MKDGLSACLLESSVHNGLTCFFNMTPDNKTSWFTFFKQQKSNPDSQLYFLTIENILLDQLLRFCCKTMSSFASVMGCSHVVELS